MRRHPAISGLLVATIAVISIIGYIVLIVLEPGSHDLKQAASYALIAITLISLVLLNVIHPPRRR